MGTLLERLGSGLGTVSVYNGFQKTAETVIMEVIIMYFETIARIVADRTGCDVSAVKPESTFSELGIDSLDSVELLMNLEDALGIEIELDQPVATVGDLDAFLQSKQG